MLLEQQKSVSAVQAVYGIFDDTVRAYQQLNKGKDGKPLVLPTHPWAQNYLLKRFGTTSTSEVARQMVSNTIDLRKKQGLKTNASDVFGIVGAALVFTGSMSNKGSEVVHKIPDHSIYRVIPDAKNPHVLVGPNSGIIKALQSFGQGIIFMTAAPFASPQSIGDKAWQWNIPLP